MKFNDVFNETNANSGVVVCCLIFGLLFLVYILINNDSAEVLVKGGVMFLVLLISFGLLCVIGYVATIIWKRD